jgi:plastocyanin
VTRAFVSFTAVLLAVGCSGPPQDTAASAPPAPASTSPSIVGKAPRGAIVTLAPAPAREFALPGGPAIMDQYAKQFVPDLLLVRVGQPVEFRNSESEPHNVNVNRVPTGTQIFSVGTAPYQKYVHTFEQPGQYAVACDIHPGMMATVVATATPYVAVADDRGWFTFADVVPGEYTLGWTVSGQSGEKAVTVGSGRTELVVPAS